VQYASRARAVPPESALRRWVRAALASDARITVRLVGRAEARRLNHAYRGRDYATNVLTFVLQETPPLEGDLALCAPVIAREARAQGKAVQAHYAHLTVHGVLHLQGYTHARDADAARMEALERRILKRLGYPDPYIPHEERHTRQRASFPRRNTPAGGRRASPEHGRYPQ
jgi:probable rRNA maturation factor